MCGGLAELAKQHLTLTLNTKVVAWSNHLGNDDDNDKNDIKLITMKEVKHLPNNLPINLHMMLCQLQLLQLQMNILTYHPSSIIL